MRSKNVPGMEALRGQSRSPSGSSARASSSFRCRIPLNAVTWRIFASNFASDCQKDRLAGVDAAVQDTISLRCTVSSADGPDEFRKGTAIDAASHPAHRTIDCRRLQPTAQGKPIASACVKAAASRNAVCLGTCKSFMTAVAPLEDLSILPGAKAPKADATSFPAWPWTILAGTRDVPAPPSGRRLRRAGHSCWRTTPKGPAALGRDEERLSCGGPAKAGVTLRDRSGF